MPYNQESILDSTKKALSIGADYDVFDADIIMHINSALSALHDLGVGPFEGFMVESDQETWDAFLGGDPALVMAKSYVYLRVRLLFDPPGNSFAMASMEKQVEEFGWRLNVIAENRGLHQLL